MPKFPLLVEKEPGRPKQGDKPAVGPVYRCAYEPDSCPKFDGVETLLDSFEQSVSKFGERPCLGYRPQKDGQAGPYVFQTYKEVARTVESLASLYQELGLKAQDKVAIFGNNCPEWMIAMQALSRANMVCVPVYETLGDTAIEFVLEHSQAKLVVVAAGKLAPLAKALAVNNGKVVSGLTGGIVYFGDAKDADVKAVKGSGLPVKTWSEAVKLGESKSRPAVRPTKKDLCTIMYTSGTTGNPKGVTINHEALLANIASAQSYLKHYKEVIGPDDVFLSYLPLAHIFDRLLEEFMLHCGGSIGYWQGDIKKLMDDLDGLKPTLFAAVPRVFERIYSGVHDQLKSGGLAKKAVFWWAYNRKLWWMKWGFKQDQASIISDILVFNKLKSKLGGRVRVILTGGAPLSAPIEEFLRVTMCAPVVQGYGLTETCAASFISGVNVWSQMQTVGIPMPVTEVRLEAVEELGYDPMGSPPRGEICIRGPGVFSGYYQDKAKTEEVMDSDGFFHTGDIAEMVEGGALRIIDRKKNIFKLSQGEYIAVEKVENAYKECREVEQVWVYGNSLESVLVAVVVPKESALKSWAKSKGVDGSFEDLCKNKDAEKWMLEQMRAAGKANGLKALEDVKAVLLEPEQFSVDNDLMTPTFKLKRAPLEKKYKKQIADMYTQLKAAHIAK